MAVRTGTLPILILLIHCFLRYCSRVVMMGSRGATLAKTGPSDFGWLVRGRPVDVLADRSFDLAANPKSSFLKPYCLDVATLQSCLQCGACTATCDLAGEQGALPSPSSHLRPPWPSGPPRRRPGHLALLRLHGVLHAVPVQCQAGQHHERAQAVRDGPLRVSACGGARRQQLALLLARLRGHCCLPCRDDRRHGCVQPRPRASPLRRHAPGLGTHPRVLGSHGPAPDCDGCRRIEGLACVVRRLALGDQAADPRALHPKCGRGDPRAQEVLHLQRAPAAGLGPTGRSSTLSWASRRSRA